jgi:hypothetical protein
MAARARRARRINPAHAAAERRIDDDAIAFAKSGGARVAADLRDAPGNDENGDSAGDILSRTVARSLPQNPDASTATLAHAAPRIGGSGTSRNEMHDSGPQYKDGTCLPSALASA